MKHFHVKILQNFVANFQKVFFLIILLMSCNNSLFAQCNLVRSKDEFSSKLTVHSNDVTLASVFPLIGSKKPWDLVMSFWMTDGEYSIMVTHASQSYSGKIKLIQFKFKDGTVIKKESSNKTGEYNSGLGYSYTFTGFDLTKEELMEFSSKDLIMFQSVFEYNPDYPIVEEAIKKKVIDKIRKDASCILSEITKVSDDKKEIKEDLKKECEYEINKTDDFTKKRIVLTKAEIIFDTKLTNGSTFMNVCGSNIDGINGLKFHRGLIATAIGATINEAAFKSFMLFDQVDLLLENEEVISFKENEPSEFIITSNTYWSVKLFTINDVSILEKLKNSPLKKIRLSINNKELGTLDIDKKYSKAAMNVINCVEALSIPTPIINAEKK